MNQKRMFALGRLKAGVMNRTEAEYELVLRQELHDGLLLWYRFEGVKLRLADNTFLTVDFAVMKADGQLQMREIKGFMMSDAAVKLKVAADQYPFSFVVIRKRPKKDGGGWSYEDVAL